ncbi:ATP-binding protein [Lysobacter sp. MMG2]|uniref:ATP-binding protein n=1 Tax=Lysobacter sp. MMG2 TaxID=2801338 RepID=UPI001C21B807|nr:ATP-binding protein [Lysobacter sp. MMG2]MBU8977756.1 ATP-binding protein [Lysobacter sp. MMG2]
MIAQRESLWDDHPLNMQCAILPTRPAQDAAARVLGEGRKMRGSIAFWADPDVGKTSCLLLIQNTVLARFPGCGTLWLEPVEDRQQAEGRLLEEILRSINYAHRIEHTLAGKRDQVNRALLALAGPRRHLFILIDEAQEFSEAELGWFKAVINRLIRIRVKVCTVLFGQSQLKKLRQRLEDTGRDDLVSRFMDVLHEYKGCRGVDDLRVICDAVDRKSEYPAGSGCPYLQTLFPRAYAAGLRLTPLCDGLWTEIAKQLPRKQRLRGLAMKVVAKILAALMEHVRAHDAAELAWPSEDIAPIVKRSLEGA